MYPRLNVGDLQQANTILEDLPPGMVSAISHQGWCKETAERLAEAITWLAPQKGRRVEVWVQDEPGELLAVLVQSRE